MRVRGNSKPARVHVEPSAEFMCTACVRLTENENKVTQTDEMTGREIEMYEYDEYILNVENVPDLEERINANLDEWLETGRNLELNQQATLYVTAQADAVDAYTMQLMEEGLI